MLSNFHTHCTFCDGKNTPEEVVQSALEKGFSALGFSSHGYSGFDLRYCLKDTQGYIAEIRRLKEKYEKDIQIYVGVEEESFSPVNRGDFDYIIGSSHYLQKAGKYYPVDSNLECFQKCFDVFDGDVIALSESYYQAFCSYILNRKPDIVGHFDLVTKFDEVGNFGILENKDYQKIAAKYAAETARSECIFEVNTGAISRFVRTAPYPSEALLHILKKANTRLILSSDSHQADTLDFGVEDAKLLLKDVGFKELYTLYNGEFIPYKI